MILSIIPARWASTRFPGKPLATIAGKTMIQRVFEQVSQSAKVDVVVVATDDERIYDHVKSFGGKVVMTKSDHPSGTDRCAEVAQQFPEAELVLNVQGDEPFILPQQIDLLAETLLASKTAQIATLVKKIEQPEALFNPNVVKAVFSEMAGAIYFSRHPIPFLRGAEPSEWFSRQTFYKHIGLYGFRRQALAEIALLSPTPLELAESLEQLRWLEYGFQIAVGITEWETIGVDTPEDLERLPTLETTPFPFPPSERHPG
ncbi:MAG TPA: 3-deoxy-manno-octulosonate cytidylyltransferase [Saprospirales bacterium]|nr:3-deoxy-manno-octulosonate cytidylyltransferase [Saprospirales bacterium]